MFGRPGSDARGDAEVLRRIIDEYANSPESVQGIGVAADLEARHPADR